VTTHSQPLHDQGAWAEQFIAAAEHPAPIPPGVSPDAAAALPVPAPAKGGGQPGAFPLSDGRRAFAGAGHLRLPGKTVLIVR
jgi:NADPH:quinone reductase-like Zn-dependent oxidoreductase